MSNLWNVQKAIFKYLSDDKILSKMVKGIFNHLPPNTPFPYIHFGKISVLDWSSKTTTGYEINNEINIFSREQGNKSIIAIFDRVKFLIDNQNLEIEGFNLVNIFCKNSELVNKSDGTTYHLICKINIVIEEVQNASL